MSKWTLFEAAAKTDTGMASRGMGPGDDPVIRRAAGTPRDGLLIRPVVN
jgi:hypothetical protein